MKNRILIVDDDKNFVDEFVKNFEGKYFVDYALSEEEFYEKFKPYSYDLVFLDIRLKREKEGLKLLKFIKEENPSLPVIMITAYPDVDSAVFALKAGAKDYIQKEKVDFHYLLKIVNGIINEIKKERETQKLQRMLSYFADPILIVGKSKGIEEVKKKIEIAGLDGEINVLIRGETGVGKEIVARNIHAIGRRKDGPFVVCLVSGEHKEMIDSTLFGHEKGAYTGATEKRKGLIEEANEGILFLDEIGDLSNEIQIKLLRVIENKEFRRLGSNQEIKVDVQFIFATNKNLEELVEKGEFRKDLYYRLKAFEIYIPPLRERKEDIPLLVDYFFNLFKKKKGYKVEGITKDAMDLLISYNWPGNVRELKNKIESALIYANAKNVKWIDGSFFKDLKLEDFKKEKIVEEFKEEIGEENMDIKKYLAVKELEFLKKGIIKYGKKREILAKELGYSNRFNLLRRVKKIFENFSELKDEFPEIAKIFKI